MVAIVTDSSSCLPRDLAERHQITIVPLAFLFDGALYHDGELSSREFYERLEASRRPVTTTSPAPGEFLNAFRRALDSGAESILCLTLSSAYSGTYSSAVNARDIAARELPGLPVGVVDTGGLAMTLGFAVLAAARAAESGATLAEAADAARRVSAEAHLVGVLDTMRYLAKSGRVPWIVHWAASALRIKPVLAAGGDRVYPVARVRTIEKALDTLMDYARKRRDAARPPSVAIMHANAPERAEALAERVRSAFSPEELLITEFTSVMGIHTGPGFVGLAFYPALPAPQRETARARSLAERDADRLEESLGALPAARSKPGLVALTGLPGSGKSYFRRELSRRYPVASLESDALRRVLFPRPRHTGRENARLFPAIHLLLERLLARGVSVIFDATNLREAHRRPLYRIAQRHGARLAIVHLTAPDDVVQQRLQARARGEFRDDTSEAGPQVYEKMRREVELIGYPHTVIDTSQDIGPALEGILRQLEGDDE